MKCEEDETEQRSEEKKSRIKRTISIREYETCDERVCHTLDSYRKNGLNLKYSKSIE